MITEEIDIFSPDRRLAGLIERLLPERLPRNRTHIHWVRNWMAGRSKTRNRKAFCVAELENLNAQVSAAIRQRDHGRYRYVLLCEKEFPQGEVTERLDRLGIRNHSRVCVHSMTRDDREQFIGRLVSTLSSGEGDERILDAYWVGDELVVSSPNLRRIRVSIEQVPCLRGHNSDALADFEIDEDGSFVYWPGLDVHLGWEQLAQIANPKMLLKARQESDGFNARYGSAIRKMREEAKLNQSEIPDLTARQVGRIERGECRATLNAIQKLAAAHKMPVFDYMDALAERLS